MSKAKYEAMTDQACHNAGRVLELEAETARLRSSHPKCDNCGGIACCLGSYESNDAWGYACDDCCAHGNEDGVCFPLADVPARYRALGKRYEALAEAASTPPPETRLAAVTEVVAQWRRADPTGKDAMLAKLEQALATSDRNGR